MMRVFELEDINSDFRNSESRLRHRGERCHQIGAKTDKTSPIYGKPVSTWKMPARGPLHQALVGSGLCRDRDELFFRDNTMMLLADAAK